MFSGCGVVVDAGAGVHHVALRTDDIRRSLQEIRARGGCILPVPANYYEDLEPRWGLEPARIAALQEMSLLYDRDDGGEYLHAYTDPFDDRFFFELVERIGAYGGYGAANAGVRMAAQAQRRPAPPAARLLA